MSIQVRNLHKRYGGSAALRDVSLDFPDGELVALLGPSGCGKTTLLRIIAGLEHADAGEVVIDGAAASATPARERRVGFVFQHYALFRHMSVFENVAFGMRMKPKAERPAPPRIRARVEELLELVQLAPFAARFPSQLSGGQRQRVALARALAVEPRVLLLDEPFGALDAKVRKELRRWLRKLQAELGLACVFVTHDQEEALEVAGRIVLMDHGRVEQVGTPETVYHHPASAFVYRFLGAVNRFPAGALARPHELEIVAEGAPLAACVTRVLALGVSARVELEGLGAALGQHFEVELTRARAAELRLVPGMKLGLAAPRARVFQATEALA